MDLTPLHLKTGMRGAYKHVSRQWLQSYLDEYAWRYNGARAQRAAAFLPACMTCARLWGRFPARRA